MSNFGKELSGIRSGAEFSTFLNEAVGSRSSKERTNVVQKTTNGIRDIRRRQIVNAIKHRFNSKDKTTYDIRATNLTIYVGDLTVDDRDDLLSVMLAKGYTSTFDVTSKMVTFAPA